MLYQLRVPFLASEGRHFKAGEFSLRGHSLSLKMGGIEPWYNIRSDGLSLETSKELLQDIVHGLRRLGVRYNFGVRIDEAPQRLKVFTPEESALADRPGAYGAGDADKPAIYPSGTDVIFVMARPLGLRLEMPSEMFENEMQGSIESNARRTDTGPPSRLEFALDLHLNSFFEASPYAQFLSRITVLEVLKEQGPQPKAVQDIVTTARSNIRQLRTKKEIPDAVGASVDTALTRVLDESIGFGVRNVVTRTLGQRQGNSAKSLYNIRSKMVHDGIIPAPEILRQHLHDLTEIVKGLLLAELEPE